MLINSKIQSNMINNSQLTNRLISKLIEHDFLFLIVVLILFFYGLPLIDMNVIPSSDHDVFSNFKFLIESSQVYFNISIYKFFFHFISRINFRIPEKNQLVFIYPILHFKSFQETEILILIRVHMCTRVFICFKRSKYSTYLCGIDLLDSF